MLAVWKSRQLATRMPKTRRNDVSSQRDGSMRDDTQEFQVAMNYQHTRTLPAMRKAITAMRLLDSLSGAEIPRATNASFNSVQ